MQASANDGIQMGCLFRSYALKMKVQKGASWSRGELVSYTKLREIKVWSILHIHMGFSLSEV